MFYIKEVASKLRLFCQSSSSWLLFAQIRRITFIVLGIRSFPRYAIMYRVGVLIKPACDCGSTRSASARRRKGSNSVRHRVIYKNVKMVPTAAMSDSRHK